jgi:hypothetical protein
MKMSKERIALSIAENLKVFIEKARPKDSALISLAREIVLLLCDRVSEMEESEDDVVC